MRLHICAARRRSLEVPRRAATRFLSVAVALALACLALAAPASPAFAHAPAGARAPAARGGLTMRPCSIGQPARCGTLWVPVDRLTGRGPKIPIRVVVVPAAGTPRHADPIVYFDGGPGSSAVDDAEQEIPELSLDTTRDDVFIDQRGTGASNLTCPELPGLVPPAMLRSKVAACVARARGELAFYSTAMAADDVAEVLTDLGYQRADLVGASYGVTSAQVFLIRHPQMVRTMTLLSGSLLSVPMFEREPQNAQQSLDNVFAECEAEPACHRAFPHLAADWQALWSSISAAPWVVPASLEANHKVGSVDADWVASEIHQLLMDATTQVDLPLAIHLLGTSTDRAATIVAISKAMPPSSSAGESSAQQLMALVIRCDEAWAADDPAHLIGATSFEYGTDVEAARWWQEVCSAVPAAGAAGGSEVLHPSAVPVLALNGEEDPQDPPANMAGARSLWPDSLELAVPDQGHDVDANLSGGCVFRLLSSFIASGRAVGLDTSCLKTVPQPPFTLSLSALAGSQ